MMTAMIFSASGVLIYPCASGNYRGRNRVNEGITVENNAFNEIVLDIKRSKLSALTREN